MSLRRNTLYNLLGPAAMLAVSLLTVPIYLKLVGETRYGVLAIVWALLGYFGIFDLGLGRATAQEIARINERPQNEKARSLGTALAVNLALGAVALVILWIALPPIFTHLLQIEEPIRQELDSVVPWLCLAVPVATVSAVLGGALQGASRFRELNIILVLGALLFQLVPLGLAHEISVSLAVLIPGALLTRLVTLALMLWCVGRGVTGWNLFHVDRSIARRLVRFGSWVTISSIVGPLMTILDRFVIGALAGARQVAHYTVPYNLAERTTLIATAVGGTLFPRFAELPEGEARRLMRDGFDRLLIAMTPLSVVAIFLVGPFLTLWIGPDFSADAAPVGRVLLLGFFINAIAYVPHGFIQARGRPDIIARIHLAELLPYFGLLAAGLWLFGVLGAGLAFLLRVAVDTALLCGFAGMLGDFLRKLAMPVGFAGFAIWAGSSLEPGSSPWWTAFACLLAAGAAWLLVATPRVLRDEIVAALTGFFGKREHS